MVLKAIVRRRSVRTFLKRPVSEKRLKAVLTAAMYAPTSWGTRAWEFIVVRDPATLKGLSRATAHSRFVKGAPLAIVVCYDAGKGRRFKEDSSIAAEHINLEAENQGLSSCFVQVADAGDPPGSAEPYVKGLLGIPEQFRVQCMMPIGYARKRPKEHSEKEFDARKVHEERF